MSGIAAQPRPPGQGLLDIYDRALPVVYGYLAARVGDRSTAEELTSEVFLAAVARRPAPCRSRHRHAGGWWGWPATSSSTTGGAASARTASLAAVAALPDPDDDPWDVRLDVMHAREVLARLGPANRLALTLRYLDGLSIPEMARGAGPQPSRHRSARRAGPGRVPPCLRGGGGPMSDPLDALRLPLAPLAPDPAFAARLRPATPPRSPCPRRGPRTREDAMPDDTSTPLTEAGASGAARRPDPEPYLAVADARAAVAWYVDVFGGAAGESVEMPDGRLGHAEVRIGDSTLMLADEFPEMGLLAPPAGVARRCRWWSTWPTSTTPTAGRPPPGATIEREPADMPYGFRAAAVVDPFGHRWLVEAPLTGAAPAADAVAPPAARPKPRTAHEVTDEHEVYTEPGDIVYVTWQVPDEQRTARFFGELLGWTFRPARSRTACRWTAPTCSVACGAGARAPPIDAKLMYHVADIAEAVAKVRGPRGHGHRARADALRLVGRLHRRPGHGVLASPPRPSD